MPAGQYNNWMPNNWSGTWQWNQPYQPQMSYNNNNNNNIQQPVSNILRVTGPESAKAYPVSPNSNVILFDGENPVFYWKSTDDSGFASIRTFTFEEQKQEKVQPTVEQIDTSKFITKNDLEALEKDVSELKEMLEGLVN